MTRAPCRCGQVLTIPPGAPDRIVCPRCGAKVRVRRPGAGEGGQEGQRDGFLRFFCPCGRRLKVNAEQPPSHGKCPDCGRVVPVPAQGLMPTGDAETRTEDLSPEDLAALDRWSRGHLSRAGAATAAQSAPTTELKTTRPAEVGLRVCPSCGRPVHLGAESCRHCGASVPRR
jgi:hypothetical protein